ncbi:MAG: hypothetical protein Q9183_007571, partial [Haloplaca sp. 2 TL-2023]
MSSADIEDGEFSSANASVRGMASSPAWNSADGGNEQPVPSSGEDLIDMSSPAGDTGFADPSEQLSASQSVPNTNGGDQQPLSGAQDSKKQAVDVLDILRELTETATSSSYPDFEMPTWADDELWSDDTAVGSSDGEMGFSAEFDPFGDYHGHQIPGAGHEEPPKVRFSDEETGLLSETGHSDDSRGGQSPLPERDDEHHDIESSQPAVGSTDEGPEFSTAPQPSNVSDRGQAPLDSSRSAELFPTKPLAGNKRKRGDGEDLYLASKRQKNDVDEQ